MTSLACAGGRREATDVAANAAATRVEPLGYHVIPVVTGPKGRQYLIDHHHLARALEDEGVRDVLVNVLADLSSLAREEFWIFLDNRSWCHPYDANGHRRDFDAIPATVAEMQDDPFRSLAGELRGAGGYAKDEAEPVQRIHLGGFPAPSIEAQGCREGLCHRSRRGGQPGQRPGGELPAGMVRTEPWRLGAGSLFQGERQHACQDDKDSRPGETGHAHPTEGAARLI